MEKKKRGQDDWRAGVRYARVFAVQAKKGHLAIYQGQDPEGWQASEL
jgi:hypothetical protein